MPGNGQVTARVDSRLRSLRDAPETSSRLTSLSVESSSLCAWQKAGSDRQTRRSAERASAEVREGAMCVQRLDDSLNSAIRTTYRSSLRSSSKHEPRGPPLEVVLCLNDKVHHSSSATQELRKTNSSAQQGCRARPSHRAALCATTTAEGEGRYSSSSTADTAPVHKTR